MHPKGGGGTILDKLASIVDVEFSFFFPSLFPVSSNLLYRKRART